jgi:ankyrin repeat protein
MSKAMKTLRTSQSDHFKPLWWLIAIFILVMAGGCDTKDSSIASLQKKNIPLTVESLSFYSNKGDLETVKLLVNAGVDVNTINSSGNNALIEATWVGKQEVVSYLLDAKANVNFISSKKLTPLSAAVNQKQESIAELLLEHGANPNIIDTAGSTPLIEAAGQGNLPLVNALLAKGADANYRRPNDKLTALRAASGANKQEIVQALKSAGASE